MKCKRLTITLTALALGTVLATMHTWHGRVVAQETEETQREREEPVEEAERLELHRRELELERAELEASFGRLELVQRLAEITESPEATASYAIMHINEYMEHDESITFLKDALKKTKNPAITRLIQIKLVETYAHADQRDAAKEQLLLLITAE